VNECLRQIQSRDGFLQFVFAPSIQRDECAFIQKAARRGGTNASPGACNDYHFIFESIHGVLLESSCMV
jgi:hypothetical protein